MRGQGLAREAFLLVAYGTVAAFGFAGPALLSHFEERWRLAAVFAWLFAAILGSALAVVRHAERVAERLGEPLGTLLLTLAITFIEVVSISAVMLHGANNPTLARDTLFAVIMIVMNGMVGLSLVLGGLRHREQSYNLHGANAYLGVIVPLVVFSLILPDYTRTTPGPTLSEAQLLFVVTVALGLYAAFLWIQTGRHRTYFSETAGGDGEGEAPASMAWHAGLLLAYLVPVVFLAERLAVPIDAVIESMHAPVQLGGVCVALLVATPEAIGAVRAARANQMQRSVNIFLGSVLSTIGLTIPAMVLISEVIDRPIVLGLEHTDGVMLILTLAVSIITFASGHTNVIQGAVHLILFAAYLLLIVQG